MTCIIASFPGSPLAPMKSKKGRAWKRGYMHNPCILKNKRKRVVYFGLGHYQSRYFCPLMCLESWYQWSRSSGCSGRGKEEDRIYMPGTNLHFHSSCHWDLTLPWQSTQTGYRWRKLQYLPYQRLSVSVQRGNAASVPLFLLYPWSFPYKFRIVVRDRFGHMSGMANQIINFSAS